MGCVQSFAESWFVVIQTVGIVGGLLFTASSLRLNARAQRIGNLLTVTEHYRNTWSVLYQRPDLSRVLDPKADIAHGEGVTEQEMLFTRLLFMHLNGVYSAQKDGLFMRLDGLEKDIRRFLSLPIPRAAWEQFKDFQNGDFVRFVEACRAKR